MLTPSRNFSSIDHFLTAHAEITDLLNTVDNCIKMIDNWSDSIINKAFLSRQFLRASYDKTDCVKIIRREFWKTIIENSGLFDSMSQAARSKLQSKIYDNPPEFNEREINIFTSNISRFYSNNCIQLLKETYSKLIGCRYRGSSWRDNKKDNLQKIEKTFRISGPISYNPSSCFRNSFSLFRPSPGSFDYQDLLSCCYVLSGKQSCPKDATFSMLAESQLVGNNSVVTTPFFNVYCYKNGNQKIVFTDEKILNLFNRFGSNGQLPDPLKKSNKNNHFSL